MWSHVHQSREVSNTNIQKLVRGFKYTESMFYSIRKSICTKKIMLIDHIHVLSEL